MCMFTGRPSVTVSMEWDNIFWAWGIGLSKESYFPNRMSRSGSRHTPLAVMQLCSRALRMGWDILPSIEPTTLTSQVGEITKSSPKWTYCELWACLFGWDLEGTTSAQHVCTASPASELSSKTRQSYTCRFQWQFRPQVLYVPSQSSLPNWTLTRISYPLLT